ncbi:MAG: 4Fe-4S binding protein [Tissierellia bacterium]|nr:4Fe-4S binding protein [Tissierellia bacterium]
MIYNKLGNTNIEVSKVCFGSLTMTPFQSNLSTKEGANLINYAYDNGVNFLDTAQLYNNYQYINKALKYIPRSKYTIATKTYAWNKQLAQGALTEALRELNTDYIDIFLLHEQESELTIQGHYEALEYLIKAKEKGFIRAVGISTHRVSGIIGANKYPEIEIVHPILNKKGLGIIDGNIDDMVKSLKKSKRLGKGIYSMKPLGGGHLINDLEESFNFLRNLDFIDSIAVGMQSKAEIDCNINLINTGKHPEHLKNKLKNKKRALKIEDYCIACGNCVNRCQQKALSIKNNKVEVDYSKCILCGYCASVCPDFYIKVV